MMSGFSRLSAARMSSSGETSAVSTPSLLEQRVEAHRGLDVLQREQNLHARDAGASWSKRSAREHGDGVVDDRIERGETVRHAAGRPGQIDDQRSLTSAGHAARQRRARKRLPSDSTRMRSAIPGASRSMHGARRFRRDVARAEPGAAGRQHQVGVVGVAPRRRARATIGAVSSATIAPRRRCRSRGRAPTPRSRRPTYRRARRARRRRRR